MQTQSPAGHRHDGPHRTPLRIRRHDHPRRHREQRPRRAHDLSFARL
ncbi:hypothetical protein BCHO_0067 [Bifidobacterium choerinum]|uniref:Uncharacterized protein n=1 Tax=Bifidobacterium choerinum TaxID=35760 RepID=A0A087AGT7_9BIFI|nr:hypothetical protein BCHO_0067 [Bifidobacterium choerinum]